MSTSTDTMLVMRATGLGIGRQIPSWIRVCLHAALIVGIFAMHHLLGGQVEHAAHQMTMEVSTVAEAGTSAVMHSDGRGPFHAVTDGADSGHGSLSVCCGLMILCLALTVGVSALIVLRRRSAERVLWQLPPPTRVGASLRIPPFHGLSPLQRSSVVRC